MYTNADSLRNKLEELKFRIEQESERPNVICITEYKAKNCKKSIPELSEYGIEGYTLFHNGGNSEADTESTAVVRAN